MRNNFDALSFDIDNFKGFIKTTSCNVMEGEFNITDLIHIIIGYVGTDNVVYIFNQNTEDTVYVDANEETGDVEVYVPSYVDMVKLHEKMTETLCYEVFEDDFEQYNENVICTYDYYYSIVDDSDNALWPRIMIMKTK